MDASRGGTLQNLFFYLIVWYFFFNKLFDVFACVFRFLANFNYFARSKKSSTHIAKTEIVIKEFIKKIDCDLVVLVQVTNPFVSYKYLDEAIIKLKRKNYDTL